jgi:Domain of unknown function (DUF4105)
MTGCWKLILLFSLFFLSVFPSAARADDEWTVSVLTVGPGPAIYERYGHIAIRLKNDARDIDVAFDWGNFSFDDPGFIGRFVRGELRYWMEAKDVEGFLNHYIEGQDRTVTEQVLNLTPAQNLGLRQILSAQNTDANRFYLYDYFRNNCATRVRDVIDEATNGALQPTKQVGTPHSYRWHNRRLVPVGLENVALLALMDLAMGPRTDVRLSRWDACFLPMEVITTLDEARMVGADGAELLLVREKRILNSTASPRNAEPSHARQPAWWWMPVSLFGAMTILGLARLQGTLPFRVAATVWQALAGLGGVLLLAMICFTGHWPVSWNENLLQFSPLSWLLGWWIVRGRWDAARTLSGVVLGLSVLGAAATIVTPQQNAPAIVLALPLHAAVWGGLVWRTRRTEPTPAASLAG